jgi:hypothetical protein
VVRIRHRSRRCREAVCTGVPEPDGRPIAPPTARMPRISSDGRFHLPTANSEWHVEKLRIETTLTLSNGSSAHGCVFVWARSKTHDGPERVKDLLNGDSAFLPFERHDAAGCSTVLYNREHILMARLVDRSEERADPGYDLATARRVTVLMSNAERVCGTMRIHRPTGQNRLSDFVREADLFGYLESDGTTYLINIRHIVELAEETSAS